MKLCSHHVFRIVEVDLILIRICPVRLSLIFLVPQLVKVLLNRMTVVIVVLVFVS